jgi:hypothetical protein
MPKALSSRSASRVPSVRSGLSPQTRAAGVLLQGLISTRWRREIAERLLALPALLLVLWASEARARNPPFAIDPREGVWIGAGEVFIHQSSDRWSVYPAGATVNKLAFDGTTLWVATDEGALRFDSGSRRSTRLSMSDGLPSQAISAVAVDDQFVWLATNKGLVRWRKLDRTLRIFTEADGLPHKAVNDALTVGRQVWFATRGGLAVYDPDSDGLRSFTAADGLATEEILELFQLGDDLWMRTDAGLSRFRTKGRTFTNFSFKDIGGRELRTFVPDGDNVWVGTENGLFGFSISSDAFVPFTQQGSLTGKSVVGVELFTEYMFIATDQEIVQYNKLKRSLQRYTEADGLARHTGASGSLISGGILVVTFPDGAELFDVQRTLWASRTFAPTSNQEGGLAWRLFGNLNLDMPYDLQSKKLSNPHYATSYGGFGLGQHFESGRSIDAFALLDYGQLELKGIRDLQYRAEYLGTTQDVVREVRIEDKLSYRTKEEGLERPLLVQGGHARVASPGENPAVSLTADVGVRRGATVRCFLSGTRQDIYQLKDQANRDQKNILPGSERVFVDGELLTSGIDYTVIYPAGKLAFLDPERVDSLSVIEVEFEVDLVPKKGLGVLSVLDFLPADKEVGTWALNGKARLISEESALYAQIDGAAPKYIDRGWTRSVYAEYKQGSRTIQVAIHDMGIGGGAQRIYDYDLPPAREEVPVGTAAARGAKAVLNLGLATAYEIKAYDSSFYIEISIDDKSDAGKQSLVLFVQQILNRGDTSKSADQAREWIAAVRAAARPFEGMEAGVRVMNLEGLSGPKDKPLRRLVTGVADARYESGLGEQGRLTAYGELAGSRGRNDGDTDGWAGMGMLRIAHPAIEGTLTGRHESEGYTPIGSDATNVGGVDGRLEDELRLSATAYPTRWLPSSIFYTRQVSRLSNGTTGTVQQALARLQLTREGLPSTSLQIGHTLVDSEMTTGRVKAVGQAEYDFAAGPLAFTGIKRLSVRALYGASQAETDAGATFAHADRVQLSRVEAKFAPTSTESAYALFRSRTDEGMAHVGDNFGIKLYHWELTAGARSAIVPGLIPQINFSEIYDDDRVTDPLISSRTSKGSFGAVLGIYPGQWWTPLTPVVIEPRYSLSENAVTPGEMRQTLTRDHRFDNRAVYFGGGKFEVELYQLIDLLKDAEDQYLRKRYVEIRNRFIYRPIYPSPITLQLNYIASQDINEHMPDAPRWGRQETYQTVLEWLRRWNKSVTTRLKSSFSFVRVRDREQQVDQCPPADQPQPAGCGASYVLQNGIQRPVALEGELRLFPLDDPAKLFLLWHGQVSRDFGSNPSQGYSIGASGIWVLGDKLYLDGDVTFAKSICLSSPCTPKAEIKPRVYLTFNL